MKGLFILTCIAAACVIAAVIFLLCGYTPAH
jgi:hypothetical protein